MESALRLPEITRVVAGYTGYKNAVGSASRALRRGWTEAKIASPKVFVFSEENDTVLALDLRKCTWSEMAPFPGDGLEDKFFYQAGDAAVYVKADIKDAEQFKIFKYDMRTDIWTEIAEYDKFDAYSDLMIGEDLYMIGADNDDRDGGPDLLKKLNISSGALSSIECPIPDSLNAFPDLSFETVESNGLIYVTEVNDHVDFPNSLRAYPNCLMLDPVTGVWTSCPNVPTFFHRAISFENDLVIVGGIEFPDDNQLATAGVWRLCKGAPAWTRLPSMSTVRSFSAAVVVEGRIYVFGGRTGLAEGEVLDSAEELDLATGIWMPLPRMPYKTEKCFAFLLSGTEGSR